MDHGFSMQVEVFAKMRVRPRFSPRSSWIFPDVRLISLRLWVAGGRWGGTHHGCVTLDLTFISL